MTRSVLNGRETKALKKPTHHGKSTKKKGVAEQQQSVKKEEKSPSNGGIMTTDLGSGSSALAPADYCNVEEELDELDEDDELHFYRALVLDLSYRCKITVIRFLTLFSMSSSCAYLKFSLEISVRYRSHSVNSFYKESNGVLVF